MRELQLRQQLGVELKGFKKENMSLKQRKSKKHWEGSKGFNKTSIEKKSKCQKKNIFWREKRTLLKLISELAAQITLQNPKNNKEREIDDDEKGDEGDDDEDDDDEEENEKEEIQKNIKKKL